MSGSNDTVLISSATLSGIANAIRSKKNVSTQFYPSEMAAQINNIQGTSPITVNITQSSNQTIRVSYSINSGNLTSNSTITCPSTVTLNATLTPDHHYNPGTLNHSTVVANWGDVVSFSATPATEMQIGTLSLTHYMDEPSNGSRYEYDETISITYNATAVDGIIIDGENECEIFINGVSENTFTIPELESGETFNGVTDIDVYPIDNSDNNGRIQVVVKDANDSSIVYDTVTINPGDVLWNDIPTTTMTTTPASPVVCSTNDKITVNCTFVNSSNTRPILGRTIMIYTADSDNGILGNTTKGRDNGYFILPNLEPSGSSTQPAQTISLDDLYYAERLVLHDEENAEVINQQNAIVPLTLGSPYTVTKSETTTGPYDVGDTITMSYTFRATGCAPASHPITYSFGADANGYDDEDTITVPALSYNATYSTTISHTVSEADILAEEVPIYMGLYYNEDNSLLTDYEVEEYTISNIEDPAGHLSITINSVTPSKSTYDPGDTVSVNFTITNDGNLTITDINVNCDLTNSGWSIVSLAPGQSATYDTDTYTITQSDSELGDDIVFDVTATGVSPDPDYPDVTVVPAEEAIIPTPYVEFSISLDVDPVEYESDVPSNITIPIAGVSFTLIPGDTVTHYVPSGQSYNVTLQSVTSFDWYAGNSQMSRLQGNTGSGDSISLTLVRKTGTIKLACIYTDGTSATCSYSGTVDGISVSGTVLGQNNTTITDVYYGASYNITFTNPPSGFVFGNNSIVYNVNGTTPTSRDYLNITSLLIPDPNAEPLIPDL